tara:strand:- start:2818 stop:3723 length:906 start_codon:yes stop_codon:yes gene_type:complete
MKILFLGLSDILQKKILPSIDGVKKIKYIISSKKKKYKNKKIKINYSNYYKAINYSKANIIYISLINSLHFNLCKYCLKKNKHVIVDKPLATNSKEYDYLINLAKRKKILLIEATVFHYSKRFNDLIKLINFKKKTLIDINFFIPKLDKYNFRNNSKLGGGCYNDMSPYAIKCIDIFLKKNFFLYNFRSTIKKKLNTGFKFQARDSNTKIKCNFGFNKKYRNIISIKNGKNILTYPMAFSQQLGSEQNIIINQKSKKYTNDNTFKNFFKMTQKVLKNKKYDNYYTELERLNLIRKKIETKF